MALTTHDLLALGLTVLLAGLIGAEREFRDKAAGFRTMILIAVGAMMFTVISLRQVGSGDKLRIAAGIVTGVGFLGAGTILRDHGRIAGLTTAATIWLAAAIGMGVGSGEWPLTTAVTGVILIVLMLFPRFEVWIDNLRQTTTYQMVFPPASDRLDHLLRIFREGRLRLHRVERGRTPAGELFRISVYGPPRRHDEVVARLLELTDLVELEV